MREDGVQKVVWEPSVALAPQHDGTVLYLVHDPDGYPHNPREASNFLTVARPGDNVGTLLKDGKKILI